MILLKNEINFVPRKSTFKASWLKKNFTKIVPITLVVFVIAVAHFWSIRTIENLKQESVELNEEATMLKQRTDALLQQREISVAVQNDGPVPRSDVIEEIKKDRNVVTPIMNEFLKYIPEDVYITGIRVSGEGQMNVDFVVPSTLHALRLVFSFNNSGRYEELPLPNLSLGQDRRTMSLNLRLRK